MGKAKDRASWYALEEAYVQSWIAVGMMKLATI